MQFTHMQMPRVLPQYAMQLSRPRLQSAIKAGKDSKKGAGKKSAISDLLKKREEVAAIADKDLYNTPEVRALLLLAASSYWKHTGKYLIEAPFEALTTAVFNAPFALLMHDRFQEGVTDPRFIYANRAALNLFEASWSELIGCPSRKSAADEASTQQERQQLLDQAATSGIITNYSGWRVSLKGKRFRITGVTLFNVEEPDGTKVGQAALFTKYERENGQEVEVQGYTDPSAQGDEASAQGPPSQEELDAAQAAVLGWGNHIRGLKEQHGKGNKDPEVQAAVASLKAWKERQAALQKRLDDELAAARAAFDDEDEEEE